MNDVEGSNYFIKRHNLRMSEDESDTLKDAHTKRYLRVLNYQSSISLASNATTYELAKNCTRSYASVIDSRGCGEINNYADATVILASHCQSESKEWNSSLSKEKTLGNSVVRKLKCQTCLNWEAPRRLSNLFSKPSDVSGGSNSPPRVRKNSEKGLSVLKEIPKLVLPKDLRSPVASISVPGNTIRLDGQGSKFKLDQSKGKSDLPAAVNTMGKSLPAPSPQEQPFGRSTFNTIRSNDELSMNISKPRSLFGNTADAGCLATDAGCNWNVGKPGNPSKDLQTNYRREFTGNFNNYDNDPYATIPTGREFERAGRGGNYGQRGGRDSYAAGQRSSDDTNRNPQDSSDAGMSSTAANFFKTARTELVDQNAKKNNGGGRGQGGGYGSRNNNYEYSNNGNSTPARGGSLQYGAQKRSLGTRRGGGVFSKFVPPVRPEGEEQNNRQVRRNDEPAEEGEVDERLKNIDPKMIELIKNEIMDISSPVCWDDIAGLEFAKSTIQEIVVWPMMRPDIFTGLRKPPKGLLLFGPPGTGKTLIGKCIASQSQSTFFSISASSLTSKWIGDGEKMVRALFAVAKCHQPAVVFIDEIDSLLTQRSDTEHESSRRIKTEFLVQLDGAGTGEEERILVVGATNRPQELDEAARRRLVKRLYIPLPEFEARRQIVERLMSSERNELSPDEINEIALLTEGYSGADMKNVCQEASLGPIRSLSFSDMHQISAEQVRPVNFQDFSTALQRVRASVSQKDLDQYTTWDQTYGMNGAATSAAF